MKTLLQICFLITVSACLTFDVKAAVTQPTIVWVDPAYTSGGGNDGHTWSYDAFNNIGEGVDSVASGGTVNVAAGTYTLTSAINLNKPNLTLQGAGSSSTIIQVSGTGDRFSVTASSVTIQNVQIQKTDKVGVQNIIYVGANNFTLKNCIVSGQFVITPSSIDPDVVRGMSVSGGLTGLQIEGNTFYGLRQPGYFSGPTTGNIVNNYTYGTKGWVMEGGDMTFTGNTWGSGAQTNVYDIAILSLAPPTAYTDIVAMSNANNGAVIEDQRVGPAVLSVVYVNASTSFSSDLGGNYHPYSSITPAITRVVAGGKINVADGTYNVDVVINKSLKLFSVNGKTTTIINGQTAGWGGGALRINSSKVTVGGPGKGFTFNSQTGGTGATLFACYVSGARDSVWIEENTFVAAPRNPGNNETYALLTDGGQTNQTYQNNIFDGMSTPRFLVYVNGFADVSVLSTNIDFIGNTFTSLAGGLTLSSSGGEVTGNYFQGTAGLGLNTSSNNVISGNFFQGVGSHFTNHTSSGADVDAVIGANTFDRRVVIKNAGAYRVETFPWGTFVTVRGNIQGAIDAASSGDDVIAAAGTYNETVQISKALTLAGAGKTLTVIQPTVGFSTGVGHKYDANMTVAAFVNTTTGVTIKDMTIDGNELGLNAVVFWNASSGTLQNVKVMRPMAFSGLQTGQGLAVDATAPGSASLIVDNCEFEQWNKNAIDIINGNGNTINGGNITFSVTGGTFTGRGNTAANAQNCIVVWERAGGTINGSIQNASFADVNYTPASDDASAILQYGSPNGTVSPISGCTFTNTEIYIGQSAGSNHTIAVSGNMYDGVNPSSATFAQLVAIENRINHIMDDNSTGLITFRANTVVATPSNLGIQQAVNVASSGDDVIAGAGMYSELLNINKSVTLLGANANVNPNTGVRSAETIIDESSIGTGGSTDFKLIQITSTGKVVINGFKFIDNDISATGMRHLIYIPTTASHEMKYNIFSRVASTSISSADPRAITVTPSATGTITVDQNLFLGSSSADLFNNKGWRRGVWSDGGGIATTITNNVFQYCRSAINLDSYTAAASITGNTFQENGTALSFGNVAAGTYTFSGNTFNNAASSTVFNLSGGIDPSALFDATGNTYDGLSPLAMTLDQLFSLEYRMVHRMNTGKSGFVMVKTNNVYVVPALFGKTGSVQGGVDAAGTGWTVNVAAGTFEEQVEITKTLALVGVGAASTTIKSPPTLTKFFTTSVNNYPIIYVHDVGGVSISDMTIDGFGRGNANYRFEGIGFRNAGGSVSGCTILDIRESPINGNQHGVGIYALADNGTARTLNVTGNTISGFQKNGTALNGADLTAIVDGNIVTGAGAVNFIAQNGLQIGFGATGSLTNNIVSNVSYTPSTDVSCGMLLYQSGGTIQSSNNTATNTQVGINYINVGGTIKKNNISASAVGVGTTSFWGIVADPGGKQHVSVQPFDDVIAIGAKGTLKTNSITSLTTSVDSNILVGDGTNGVGIEADAMGTETLNFSANQNSVTNWGKGFVLYKDAGATLTSVLRRNSIAGNVYGVLDQTGVLQDAKENWWGHASGPRDPKSLPNTPNYNNLAGLGDSVSSYVDYNPWYLDAGMATLSVYTLTYTAGPNGTIVGTNPQTGVNHGSNGTLVTATPNLGYYFVSWSDGYPTAARIDSNVTANVNATATFAINQYTVTFNANTGTGTMSNQTANYNTPTALTLNTFTKIGYGFSGWNTAANGSGTSYANGAMYNFTANITLYAQWTLNAYSVTFQSNGGSAVSPITGIPYNTAVGTLPANPTRVGHSFVGWFTDDGTFLVPFTSSSIVTADITVYAEWTINQYAVTFDANGGTGSMSNQSANYNTPTALTTNAFTRTGYTFSGWNTAANGSGTSYVDGAIYDFTASSTLYAQWTINQYTVTFDANGGTGSMSNQSANYNTPTALTLNAFTKTGYSFSGWNTAANGLGTSYADGVIYDFTASSTLYAQWTITAAADTQKYRTISYDSLAYSRDLKGKLGKPIKKKPIRVEFCNTFVNGTGKSITGMQIIFGVAVITGDLAHQFSVTPTPLNIRFNSGNRGVTIEWQDSIPSGGSVSICGWGSKGKLQSFRFQWIIDRKKLWTPLIVNPSQFSLNQLRLPMPNFVNVVDEIFARNGFGAEGLVIGIPKPDSSKVYGWVRITKMLDFYKSIVFRGLLHTTIVSGFDYFDRWLPSPERHYPFHGELHALRPYRQDNRLFADLLSLKISVTASALGIIPSGLGNLIYDDGVTDVSGLTLQQLIAHTDSAMTFWFLRPDSEYVVLDSVIRRINKAFEGSMDTTSFGASLALKGVRRLQDVSCLRANPAATVPITKLPIMTRYEVPDAYKLYQNYPNPFNPITTVQFDLPEEGVVNLKVYNLLGQEVVNAVTNEVFNAGIAEVEIDGSALASGIYFYQIVVQSLDDEGNRSGIIFSETKKMLLAK